MIDIEGGVEAPICHCDWHESLHEYLSFDNWNTDEAFLLLAGVWPFEAKISETAVSSPRYGVIEPPVIIHAGLLDQECNVQFREDYERLRILAGRRFRLFREQWERGNHSEARYPPSYFIDWAKSKNFSPCWLNIWQQQLELARAATKEVSDSMAVASTESPGKTLLNLPPKKTKNVWDAVALQRLLEESKMPGMTHLKLADKYGVERQRIGALLKKTAPKKRDVFSSFASGKKGNCK